MEIIRTVDHEGRPAWRWDPEEQRHKSYVGNFLEALSQVLQAVIGGHANLTFSAQCGAWLEVDDWRGRFFAPIINFIFRDERHCQNAWLNKV